MNIRRAAEKDIPRILELLSQVLEIHARIRPDIFLSGTTKYTAEELSAIIRDDARPIFAAADESDRVLGYAFCQIREPSDRGNMVPFRSVFIDDLCVDEACRGQGVGKALFRHVVGEAKALGCYEVSLNVWEGNDARRFYDAMGMRPKETQMELILKEAP